MSYHSQEIVEHRLQEPSRAQRPGSRAAPRHTTPKANSSNVIEITDSEDEADDVAPMQSVGHRYPVATAAAGSSRTLLNPNPSRALSSGSNDNLPESSKRPALAKARTLLPSGEENTPPLQSHQGQVTVADVKPNNPLPSSAKPPSPEPDPMLHHLAQILEVVPDVQPDHATSLIVQYLPQAGDQTAQTVLHILFENPNYPKVEKKGKRKAEEESKSEHKRPRLELFDYGSEDREFKGGTHYIHLALDQLMVDFPDMPKPFLRKILSSKKSLFAPAHMFLTELKLRGPPFPYIPKKTALRPNKGKGTQLRDAEFERELEWILSKQGHKALNQDAETAEKINEKEYEDCADGIECGCCFSSYPFDKMIQCQDAHLFCSSCVTAYAEGLLGSHNINIVCMDQSGCKQPFPVSELQRILSGKLMELYERVKQRKEIEMAGLENLEECPFCDYKCVIENPDEKLFRCGNEESCGAITCRQCKKADHLPKSCKEMEEDRVLDGRHAIEEAMTRALMRNCPNCGKGFVKEDGCNKMICPNCRTMSCYVCRKIIRGYDHFAGNGPQGSSSSNSKCPLWESVEHRHAEEVKAAAAKAMEEYKRENPDVDEKEIKVDLPTVKPIQAGMAGLPAGYLPPVAQLAPVGPHLMHANLGAIAHVNQLPGVGHVMNPALHPLPNPLPNLFNPLPAVHPPAQVPVRARRGRRR